MMTNFDLSQKVFDFLKQADVQTVVVCAGARNAPLVMALNQTSFKVIQFFEERSAAFFALGLIKSSGQPVAVFTTSGTAVAELLPAAVEATYQALPLILVTADRPKNYRGSGAPQTIEQVKIFSDYVESVYDLDVKEKEFSFSWSFKKPIQLNVCFDEPLIDKASGLATQNVVLTKKSQAVTDLSMTVNPRQAFVILGELSQDEAALVKSFLLRTKIPFYAESLSQLSGDPDLATYSLSSSEILVKKAFQQKLFDSVLRIGGIPTLRFWRDLEAEFSQIPVINFSDRPFSGLSRTSQLFSLSSLSEIHFENEDRAGWVDFKSKIHELQKKKLALLEKYPLSEPSCVQSFSNQVGEAPLYLGNSLPIRHWDAFSVNQSKSLYGNRGANGIDGQISTYLGWSEAFKNSFCFVGDLTALYDLAALGLTPQLADHQRHVVVLNNFGGQIFQRVLKNKMFINEHQIQFQNWAQMWGWNYLLVKSPADFHKISQASTNQFVIEIQPNPEQTRMFWDEWDLECQKM